MEIYIVLINDVIEYSASCYAHPFSTLESARKHLSKCVKNFKQDVDETEGSIITDTQDEFQWVAEDGYEAQDSYGVWITKAVLDETN